MTTRDGKIVAVAQTKGGSCKSTVTHQTMGMLAAERPQIKILKIDTDLQSHQGYDVVNKHYYPHTDVDGGLTKQMEDMTKAIATRRKIPDAKVEVMLQEARAVSPSPVRHADIRHPEHTVRRITGGESRHLSERRLSPVSAEGLVELRRALLVRHLLA